MIQPDQDKLDELVAGSRWQEHTTGASTTCCQLAPGEGQQQENCKTAGPWAKRKTGA